MQKSNIAKVVFFLFLSYHFPMHADDPESKKLAETHVTAPEKPEEKAPAQQAKKVQTEEKAEPAHAKTDKKPSPQKTATIKPSESKIPASPPIKPEIKIPPPKAEPNKAEKKSDTNLPTSTKAIEPVKPAVAVDKLADDIQKQYNLTRSATFRFEQIYTHPFLSGPENTTTSRGNVAYNKSTGSMMWNYQEPTNRQKKFYINGNKFTFYSISDKIAYTHDCYDKDTLSASVAFLLGTGNLKNAFTITAFEGEPSNQSLMWLSLIPKEANSPVKKISLGAGADGKVQESIVEDPSGGRNHFKFIDFKTNPKISNSVFIFKAPRGVSIQPMPNVSCTPKAVDTKPAANKPPVKKN